MACIDCGEVRHKFFECPKQKPWRVESGIGLVVPNTRPHISELFSALEESVVIESTSDYTSDPPTHHYLNETIELNNVSGDLVHPACTDIDTALDFHREPTVRQDSHPFDKSVDPGVKRLKTRRLMIRKKNLPTNGWRLSDIEFE